MVIATGARYRRLDVQRSDYFEKMSIYYAASQAEALLCAGDPVAVVGGGNSAGQAAVFLSRHAAQVTLLVRERDLGENMSRYLVDQVTRLPNVHVILGAEVRELHGDEALEAVTVQDSQTGARRVVSARAMFVFIGAKPCTGWLNGLVELDDRGFIRTGPGGLPETSPEPCSSRPAVPAYSPPEMSAAAQPNESPPPWGRARWLSGSSSKEPGRPSTSPAP